MSDEELNRRLNAGCIRKCWNKHGSWALLLVVGVMCYAMGAQHAAYNMGNILRDQAKKIELLTEQNTRLSMTIVPTAQRAAEDASRAAEKVEKLTKQPE